MRHVAVWGCPRSGTSITFQAYKTHPAYRAFFEVGEWLLEEIDWAYPTVIKNPWGRNPTPGLSADLDVVCRRDMAHIWVVRHPHDAVASLLPGMGIQPHPPTLPGYWLHKPVVDQSAALWRYWNETGLDKLQAKVDVLTVRYEDLVIEPLATVRRMYSYSETEWMPETEGYLASINNTPGYDEAEFQVRWHRSHERHVGRGDLTELERVTVDNIVGDIPKLFGYK